MFMLAMIARSSSKDKSKKWASAEEEEEADAANMNDSADDEGTTSSRGTTSADDDVHKGGGGKKKKQDQHQDDKGGEQKKKKKRVAVAAAAYGDDDDDDDDEHNNESALNSKWEESFQRLMAFREKHGHCLVPNRYPEDPQLGSWVSTQRRQYKILTTGSGMSTPMTPERAERLEEIGFQWSTKDPRHVPWEKRYSELVDFAKKYGHAQVPIGWKQNVQLSNWVSTQRQEYKLLQKGRNTRLTPERIELLENINFIWEAQRGGPRRKRRATVCVPPRPTPVQAKEPHALQRAARGGRGGVAAGATSAVQQSAREHQYQAAVAAASLEAQQGKHPEALTLADAANHIPLPYGMANSGMSADFLANHPHLAAGQFGFGGAGVAQGLSLQGHPNNAAMGLAAAAANARSQAAAFAQLDAFRPFSAGLNGFGQASDLDLMRAAASANPSAQSALLAQHWRMLPHGGYQQPSNLGIFPIATPQNISAAGYQLGYVPTTLVQNNAPARAQGLNHASIGGDRNRNVQELDGGESDEE